ncbi:MAG: hypothetical protein E3J72_19275 [Planctomycetota bacterium]|nr:MAG: hypothetical protein E3J72_19275 [Planctomycetota bacterium]
MKTAISIAYGNDGRLQMGISGKLTGHVAREGLELLKLAVEKGKREISLDLRETTSLDSLGIKIFDWIRSRNGDLKVGIIPPIRGVSDEELASITRRAS